MTIKLFRVFICLALVSFWAARGSAVVLFSDNFNVDSSGAWTQNKAPTADAAKQQATFAYDYSEMGIPAIPGNSDTLGLRLRANIPIVAGNEVTTRPAGTVSGLSVSPTGKNFGTNYQMSFYAWANFCGGPNVQGLADVTNSEGGTFNIMFGVGTSGTVPLVVGNTGLATNGAMDGIGFATTGDGGITNDFRVYPKSGTIVPGTTAGVYAAGNTAAAHSSADPFYTALFPAVSAPLVQQDISTAEYGGDAANTQAGFTLAGAFGFAWQKVVIAKTGNTITWKVNDTLFATFDATTVSPLGGANIALGVSDVNTTTTRHPSLVFTVFDNLEVTTIPGLGPGDFNHDNAVNSADFEQWKGDFGENPDSDSDGNGFSDGGDFLAWQRNFDPTVASTAGTTTVPEPAAVFIATLGAMAISGWRRVARRGAVTVR